jgi:hypothetical protein
MCQIIVYASRYGMFFNHVQDILSVVFVCL